MGVLTLAVPGQVVAWVLQVFLDQVLVEVIDLGVSVNIPNKDRVANIMKTYEVLKFSEQNKMSN